MGPAGLVEALAELFVGFGVSESHEAAQAVCNELTAALLAAKLVGSNDDEACEARNSDDDAPKRLGSGCV